MRSETHRLEDPVPSLQSLRGKDPARDIVKYDLDGRVPPPGDPGGRDLDVYHLAVHPDELLPGKIDLVRPTFQQPPDPLLRQGECLRVAEIGYRPAYQIVGVFGPNYPGPRVIDIDDPPVDMDGNTVRGTFYQALVPIPHLPEEDLILPVPSFSRHLETLHSTIRHSQHPGDSPNDLKPFPPDRFN